LMVLVSSLLKMFLVTMCRHHLEWRSVTYILRTLEGLHHQR